MTQISTSMQRIDDTLDAPVIIENKGVASGSFYFKPESCSPQTTFTLLIQVLQERLSGADQIHPGVSKSI